MSHNLRKTFGGFEGVFFSKCAFSFISAVFLRLVFFSLFKFRQAALKSLPLLFFTKVFTSFAAALSAF
jgi:hypothetical protein